jgi:general secretion pathway protein H
MDGRVARAMTPISVTESGKGSQTGFTLLELLLVLVILGAASALIVPNLGTLDSRGFNAQVREATTLLNYARRIAVVKGLPMRASFIVGSGVAVTQGVGHAGSWESGGIAVSFRDSANQRVDVEGLLEIVFFPEGGSTGGEITLSQGNRQAVLTIDPFSGRVNARGDDNR